MYKYKYKKKIQFIKENISMWLSLLRQLGPLILIVVPNCDRQFRPAIEQQYIIKIPGKSIFSNPFYIIMVKLFDIKYIYFT